MPLRGLLYRKLKQKVAETKAKNELKKKAAKSGMTTEGKAPVKIKFNNIKTKYVSPMPAAQKTQENELIKGSARYWGGHFLFPIKTVELGELVVKNQAIEFVKYGFLKRPEWSMEIPLTKVEWKKVTQATEEDGVYTITCFTIPFKDDKGIRHQPKFSVENSGARERFSKFLYQKMSRRSDA